MRVPFNTTTEIRMLQVSMALDNGLELFMLRYKGSALPVKLIQIIVMTILFCAIDNIVKLLSQHAL